MTGENPRKIGKFEILSEIGQGSMGTVHLARDPVLDREVALKTILPGSDIETEARERFLREARSVARLQHPNIITIFELGEMDGVPFIAMEYLEGVSLAHAMREGRPLTFRERLEVVHQLCRGLGYAHQRGVIHRDVKPSNIFLLPSGAAKILDFGVAWLEGGTFATRTGMLVGTPAYMAPEQFSGGDIDHRVDMWAVGVILHELMAGRRPFDGDTVPSLIYQIVHTPMPALDPAASDLPMPVIEIIARALAKEPDDRYPDMEAMAAAIEGVLGGDGVAAEEAAAAATQAPAPVAGGEDETAVLTGERVATLRREPAALGSVRDLGVVGEAGPLRVIAVSPDERWLAIGGVDGAIRMWDLDNRVTARVLRSRVHLRTGHAALTTRLAFSADGRLLASGHIDGSVYVWDANSGFEMEAKLRHEGAVGGVAFLPDGRTLITGGADSTLKFWEIEAVIAGDARRQMRRQPAEVTALAVSSDGDLAVSGHANRNLRAHEPASGRLTATFHGMTSAPSTVALSPDGTLLACGGRDGGIRLFRVASRALLRTFSPHPRPVSSLVFFPDGRHLASVAMDSEVAVWGVAREERLATLAAGSEASCASVVVLGGARQLLCGVAEGTLRAWEF